MLCSGSTHARGLRSDRHPERAFTAFTSRGPTAKGASRRCSRPWRALRTCGRALHLAPPLRFRGAYPDRRRAGAAATCSRRSSRSRSIGQRPELTFFEAATLAAFLVFARARGRARGDRSRARRAPRRDQRARRPLATAITRIALDHADRLGSRSRLHRARERRAFCQTRGSPLRGRSAAGRGAHAIAEVAGTMRPRGARPRCTGRPARARPAWTATLRLLAGPISATTRAVAVCLARAAGSRRPSDCPRPFGGGNGRAAGARHAPKRARSLTPRTTPTERSRFPTRYRRGAFPDGWPSSSAPWRTKTLRACSRSRSSRSSSRLRGPRGAQGRQPEALARLWPGWCGERARGVRAREPCGRHRGLVASPVDFLVVRGGVHFSRRASRPRIALGLRMEAAERIESKTNGVHLDAGPEAEGWASRPHRRRGQKAEAIRSPRVERNVNWRARPVRDRRRQRGRWLFIDCRLCFPDNALVRYRVQTQLARDR